MNELLLGFGNEVGQPHFVQSTFSLEREGSGCGETNFHETNLSKKTLRTWSPGIGGFFLTFPGPKASTDIRWVYLRHMWPVLVAFVSQTTWPLARFVSSNQLATLAGCRNRRDQERLFFAEKKLHDTQ